jgi:hypothetical protein
MLKPYSGPCDSHDVTTETSFALMIMIDNRVMRVGCRESTGNTEKSSVLKGLKICGRESFAFCSYVLVEILFDVWTNLTILQMPRKNSAKS